MRKLEARGALGLSPLNHRENKGPPAAWVSAPMDQFVDVTSLGPMKRLCDSRHNFLGLGTQLVCKMWLGVER